MSKNYHDDSEIEYVGKSKEYIKVAKSVKQGLGSARIERDVRTIREEKIKGLLDYKYIRYIKPSFEIIVNKFVKVLEDSSIDNEPNFRRLLAYNTDFPEVFNTYGYELSSMMCTDKTLSPKKNKAFFDFPLFFKEACRSCGIYRYAEMNIEDIRDILKEVVDFREQVSSQPRKDRKTLENETLLYMHTKDNDSNPLNKIAKECSLRALKDTGIHMKVEDVNSIYGTGYGFDLLIHESYGEMLVAVKASRQDGAFRLSKSEHEIMVNNASSPCTQYFVHSYIFDDKDNELGCVILKYDSENDVLVDICDNSNVYNIEERTRERHGRTIVNYVCTPVKVKINNQKNPMKYLFTMD